MGYANSIGATYFETSAKTGINVDEMFGALAKMLVSKKD